MTIRPNSVQAAALLAVLFVALAALTSALGRPSPHAIIMALLLLAFIGVRALRVARSGRAADWNAPEVTDERIGSWELGLIVLAWSVVAVVVMAAIALVSLSLGLEGESSTIAGLLGAGSFLGILIAGPILTLRYGMRWLRRHPRR